MKRNKTAEFSFLVVFAFVAGLFAFEPFTNVLASSKQFVQDQLSSSHGHGDHQNDENVSPKCTSTILDSAEMFHVDPMFPVRIQIS